MAATGRRDITDSGNSQKKSSWSFGAFIAGFDWLQIVALAFLLITGLIFIHATGVQVGTPAAALFFKKQLTQWIPLGVLLWGFFALQDHRKFYFKAGGVLFFLLTTIALILVLKYGIKVYGARRWLMLGSFRLQPSEFGKLSLILVLAWLFSTPRFSGAKWAGILLGGVIVAVPAILIFKEPDLGGTLILFPIAGAMLIVSGLKWRWLLLIAAAGAAAFFALRAVVLADDPPPDKKAPASVESTKNSPKRGLLKPYQKKRLRVFFKPNSDISNSGHNVYQSRLAVGAGGIWGKGIGNGTQNQLGFLPQTVANNDFIFSVIAEETGFMGCLMLLAGYSLLFFSILRTALKASSYGRLIAIGIGAMLFCHTYINIGMCIGLAPVTGLPLPFVSYGGSFIFVGMISMGILQSIYRCKEKEL
jgi:rod shape determining protein RodA